MSVVNGLQQVFGSPLVASFNPFSQVVFRKLNQCHTAELGWHTYRCNDVNCGKEKVQYHSCGNRHCPNCGSMKREAWIEARMQELLPTAYYHVVFTLPHEWNPLIMGNRKELFKLLFDSASETLLNYGNNLEFLGAMPGITMVLHTWGQDLSFHPHVHCIVSGGGLDEQTGKWIAAKRKNEKFIFPVSGMRSMFKAIFLKKIRKLKLLQVKGVNLQALIEETGKKTWNVFAKAPFGSPAAVVEYLGRYTHKIAITKHRILAVTEHTVRFSYKDYADGDKVKEMELSKQEFLRRFEQHILPRGFVKIRHYGYLQNRNKQQRINTIRKSLELEASKPVVKIPVAIRMLVNYGVDINQCPCCKQGKLELVSSYYPRAEARNKASPIGSMR